MCFHNHIILSSVALDCEHKFRNFLGSGKAFAQLSDEICKENRLSVVEHKNHSGVAYDKWEGRKVKLREREKLCIAIDEALKQKPEGFDALMKLLEEAGWSIKRGAQLSFKGPDGKRYLRMDTLGESYSEENLRAVLEGKRVHKPRRYRGYIGEVGLIIDIKEKLRQGKGKGYQRWAENFNIGAKSKTMVYIKTHNIESVEMLDEKIHMMLGQQKKLQSQIDSISTRMDELIAIRKAVLDYRGTKEVFAKFHDSGWSPEFLAEHEAEIQRYKDAATVYKAHGGKLPKLADISAEFQQLNQQKKAKRDELTALRTELHEAQNVRSNVGEILGMNFKEQAPSIAQKVFPRKRIRA